jgi:hypothetical protein
MIPESTPHHPAFDEYLKPVESIALRHDDLDPGYTLYEIDDAPIRFADEAQPLADFGGAVQLLEARWLSPQVEAGETAELLTIWKVINPAKVGPVHLPTSTTDVVFFTHVLNHEDEILAQRDALDAPAWSWQEGDILLQVHPISVPGNTEPGDFPSYVGIYDRPTGERLPLIGSGGSLIEIFPLRVAQS